MDIKNLIISFLIGFMYYSNGIFDDKLQAIYATAVMIIMIYILLINLDNYWNDFVRKKNEKNKIN